MNGKKKIDADVAETLRACRVAGRLLYLPDQLERKDYQRVNAVIVALGGAWRKKLQAHEFPFPAAEVLSNALEAEAYVDRAKSLQFYPTPEPLARDLVAALKLRNGSTVLEPSAGVGSLIRQIGAEAGRIVAVEIDGHNAAELRKIAADDSRVEVVEGDFLAFAAKTTTRFDAVVMNPPFAGGADIEHVRAAFALLRSGGRLVAVVSEGPFFREDRRSAAFREWLRGIDADVKSLPAGSFRESGAAAATRRVVLRAA